MVGDVNFGFGAHSDFMGMRGRVHDMQFGWFQRTLGDGEALEPDTNSMEQPRSGPYAGQTSRKSPVT
ncbi:hypothetical protein [Streptomyces sp. NPDC058678]|uniref:hypothetical protein n=1 Tax=Streptomyces sp. NPDC058678 TaxID=3346595 RepID=UPI0036672F29